MTRTKRARRIAASRELGEFVKSLRGHESECDSTWWSRHNSDENRDIWLVSPISRNGRGGDPLGESNYEVAQSMLEEASSFSDLISTDAWTGKKLPAHDRYWTGGTSERTDLWPGGVIETILVRADDAGALRCLRDIVRSLEDYPILDESDLSEREWAENHPNDHECYDSYGDCSCDVAEHRRLVEAEGPEVAHAGLPWERNQYVTGELCRSCEICGTDDWKPVPVVYLGDDLTAEEIADTNADIRETR